MANLLPVSGFATCDMSEGLKLLAHQISTKYLNALPRYYYFRFLKTNGLSSACDSAMAYQILCKLYERWRSYDVIFIVKDDGHSVANLLPVSDLATSDIYECPELLYRHTNFRPDISIYSTAEILLLPVCENKRPPYWNSTSGFDFHCMWFSICTPNFIVIGPPAAVLWRHSDFQDGGRQPCWIWFRVMIVSALSTNFGLIGFTVLETDRFSHFGILAWNCLFTSTFNCNCN